MIMSTFIITMIIIHFIYEAKVWKKLLVIIEVIIIFVIMILIIIMFIITIREIIVPIKFMFITIIIIM